ncbi:MAG: DNA polymerase IV [bacterium]|nr:DNA polymerase IV [bacterium]
MNTPRKILHLDLDAFFCAVEEQRDPSLKNKPFAVGAAPEDRGVVASCSYAARRFGVHSAMPMVRALRLCPALLRVPRRHSAYEEASEKVMECLYALTPQVERVSIDEAFLDVSDCPESARDLAYRLQTHIRTDLDLPSSLGVAANKLIAKIANNVGKARVQSNGPPNAITVVLPGEEAAFLAPLPASALWGVGPRTAAALEALGIHTVEDLARRPEQTLADRFGRLGTSLAQYAQGIDNSPVETVREAKSLNHETTFSRDVIDRNILLGTLLHLCERVGRDLRRENLTCRTLSLKYRTPDFHTLTRQSTLNRPSDIDRDLYTAAEQLFNHVWHPGRPVRLLGVSATNLGPPAQQLTLWDTAEKQSRHLQQTLDTLRDRFGEQGVRWGKEKRRGDP